MKFLITENQKESLKNNLMNIVNRLGLNAAIKVIGSFSRLLKIVGEDSIHQILNEMGINPNLCKIIKSIEDVPTYVYPNHSGIPGGKKHIENEIRRILKFYGPIYIVYIAMHPYIYQRQRDNIFILSLISWSKYSKDYPVHKEFTNSDIMDVIEFYFSTKHDPHF